MYPVSFRFCVSLRTIVFHGIETSVNNIQELCAFYVYFALKNLRLSFDTNDEFRYWYQNNTFFAILLEYKHVFKKTVRSQVKKTTNLSKH